MKIVPPVSLDNKIALRRYLQKLASKLGPEAVPTFAGLTLTGLTASTLLGANANKLLESVTVGTGLDYTRPNLTLSHLGIEALTDPGVDKILFWDDSATPSACKWLGVGNSIAITTTTIDTIQDIRTSATPTFDDLTISTPVNIYALSHDSFADFVANEHIDHTIITLTAGSGIAGGGTIAANRTFDLDINSLAVATIAAGDFVPFWDITATATNKKITFANFETTLNHDSLTGFVSGEHFLQTAITNVLTTLATGLLKVTTTTGALSVITDSSANWNTAYTHSQLVVGNPHVVTPTELSLVIGTDVQAFGAALDDLSTLTPPASDGQFIVATGVGAFQYESGATARTSIGLGTGNNAQFNALGINTVPSNKLHVNLGTVGTIARFDGAGNEFFGIRQDAENAWRFYGYDTVSSTFVNFVLGNYNLYIDAVNDRVSICTGGSVQTPVTKLTIEGTLTLKEQAAADGDTAAYGQIWVKSDAPNTLMYTDDAGTDFTVDVTPV